MQNNRSKGSRRKCVCEILESRLYLSTSNYAFSVVAQDPTIDGGAAINDSGQVAYVQSNSPYVDGKAIFTEPAGGIIDPHVQINDAGTVVWRELSGSISRIWESGQIVAGLTTQPLPNFNNSLLGYTSGQIHPNPSINLSGKVAFSATVVSEDIFGRPIATQNVVATTGIGGQMINPNTLSFAPPNAATHPQIADDGSIVVRNGNLASGLISPILIWDNTLTTPKFVAGSSRGFSALGVAPGITADATAVVFEGNLVTPATLSGFQGNLVYADGTSLTLPTQTAGAGVFASIAVQGVSEGTTPVPRVIVRLAGPADGLSFPNLDSAVAISSIQGATQPTYEAVFLATGANGQIGLYGEQVALSVTNGEVHGVTTSAPTLVAARGTPIQGLAGTISALAIDHPVNNRGDIAFVATLDGGARAVVVAKSSTGLDVSHNNGMIDWSQVRGSGRSFAYVKASQGTTFPDLQFIANVTGAAGKGMEVGAYHFAAPNLNKSNLGDDAAAEAAKFVSVAGSELTAGNLEPVLDLEDGSSSGSGGCIGVPFSQLAQWVTNWIADLKADLPTVKLDPILYMNGSYADAFTTASPSLLGYALWISDPDFTNSEPTIPPDDIGGWKDWAIEQYYFPAPNTSPPANVPGISKAADLDIINPDTTFEALQITPANPVATINSATPSSNAAIPGEPVTLSLSITASAAMMLLAGATLQPTGGGSPIQLTGATATNDPLLSLAAGANVVAVRSNLPATAAAGTYDLTVNLWQDTNANGAIDAGDIVIGSQIFSAAFSVARAVTINSASADQVTLTRDLQTQYTDWATGSSSGTLASSSSSALVIDSPNATDTLKLDYSHGDPLPATLVLNGEFVVDGLPLTSDPLAGHSVNIGSSTISIAYPAGQGTASNPAVLGTRTAEASVGTASQISIIQRYLKDGHIFSSTLANGLVISDTDTGSAIVLRPALPGDADLSGKVDFNDLVNLARTYGRAGVDWSAGDFNYDGSVGFDDLVILARNYGKSASPPAAAAAELSAESVTLPKAARHGRHAYAL